MLSNRDNVLLLVVVKHGQATPFSRAAREVLDTGHTIMLARGTASEKWTRWLGVEEVKREIIVMIVPKDHEDAFYELASRRFHLDEAHEGIVASVSVLGSAGIPPQENDVTVSGEEAPVTHKAVFVIVDKGESEDIMDIAEKAGARGGTLIHGRGAGIHEHEMLFNLQVEPEKDILMIITPTDEAMRIVDAIRTEVAIDEPGRGMMFMLDVTRVMGMGGLSLD